MTDSYSRIQAVVKAAIEHGCIRPATYDELQSRGEHYSIVGDDRELRVALSSLGTALEDVKELVESVDQVLRFCFIEKYGTENFSSVGAIPMGISGRQRKVVREFRTALSKFKEEG